MGKSIEGWVTADTKAFLPDGWIPEGFEEAGVVEATGAIVFQKPDGALCMLHNNKGHVQTVPYVEDEPSAAEAEH